MLNSINLARQVIHFHPGDEGFRAYCCLVRGYIRADAAVVNMQTDAHI